MPALNESNYLGDVLKYEAPNLFSRENAVIGTGANLTLGAVLGRITATGKYVLLAPAAVDGSQTAAAILLADAAAATADAKGLMLAAAVLHEGGAVGVCRRVLLRLLCF
ncbi:MAG: head decoration protein [Pseudomonadota bacterium]